MIINIENCNQESVSMTKSKNKLGKVQNVLCTFNNSNIHFHTLGLFSDSNTRKIVYSGLYFIRIAGMLSKSHRDIAKPILVQQRQFTFIRFTWDLLFSKSTIFTVCKKTIYFWTDKLTACISINHNIPRYK